MTPLTSLAGSNKPSRFLTLSTFSKIFIAFETYIEPYTFTRGVNNAPVRMGAPYLGVAANAVLNDQNNSLHFLSKCPKLKSKASTSLNSI